MSVTFTVKSGKLVVFNPDFLLWACLIPDKDPIPLIQSPGVNDGDLLVPKLQYHIPECLLLCIIL